MGHEPGVSGVGDPGGRGKRPELLGSDFSTSAAQGTGKAAIERLDTRGDWTAFYPVVRDFWPVEDGAEHVAALAELEAVGYEAHGRRADEPVTFSGLYRLVSPWYGDFAWLADLVTRPGRRGEGHGTACYRALESRLRADGCETFVLASGTERDLAHAFYRDEGFERTEYWFEKDL